jgi:hypothetical protein
MAVNAPATQEFVPIKEVRKGTLVLKDGSLRAILMCSSVNLALKSSEEQVATIGGFQDFLNTLEFPTQIVVQSRKYDIRPYVMSLEKYREKQTEELLKIQTTEYMHFIEELTSQINIMNKQFFVVIPYNPLALLPGGGKESLLDSLLGKTHSVTAYSLANDSRIFEENRMQLEQRVGVIEQGLSRIGIRAVTLGTEEVIELFYKTFNPGDSVKPIHMV